MLKSLLPNEVKVNFTIDNVRLKSNLTASKTIKFTKKIIYPYNSRYYSIPFSGLNDIEGLVHLIPGHYKSDEPVYITGIDKVHLKRDCTQGNIVKGIREANLYSSALSSPAGHKIYKEPRIQLFKKINKSVLSQITIYLEDDDYKAVESNGQAISFTYQLNKNYKKNEAKYYST